MQIADSVKVIRLSGKYSKYMFSIIEGKKCLFRPKREGIIVGFPQKGIASVAFLGSSITDSPYWRHVHQFYVKDLTATKHSKNSQISLKLENLRLKYNIAREESMK